MTRVFTPFRKMLMPVIHGCDHSTVLAAARAMAAEGRIILVGLVAVGPGESLSGAAKPARQVRKVIAALTEDERMRSSGTVRVSHAPWEELTQAIQEEAPDLLVLEWPCYLDGLKVSVSEALSHPPCDVALVRGPFPHAPGHVLVPARGGPHAELAMRVGLSLRPDELTALHITSNGGAKGDAPFRGLAQVLRRLPGVRTKNVVTASPAPAILRRSRRCDIVVMGATAKPLTSRQSLGPVADQVLRESRAAVIAVKTRRPMPLVRPDETAGVHAISILVDKWFAENTFRAREFASLRHLVTLKQAQAVSVSLALPALNEEETVGNVIRTIQRALMEDVPLLDEMVLIDSNSTDRTREIAAGLGVPVYVHQQVLPALGARPGKGEALWKSLLVTQGDIIAWIDTDIVNIHPRFVYGIVGPLLLNPRIQFVKGFYRRPLRVGDKTQAGGGGRVTELTARPMLNLFYPELSGVVQPLSGEYAGRRTALEQLPFFSGYGVETGLLIDVFERFGLEAIAQVDLLERIHHNQPLEALSKMSFAILQAVIRKLERRYGRAILEDVNKSIKLIHYRKGDYFLDVEEVVERERPPMVEVPEYADRQHVAA